jgi:hypothetical protein
MNARSLFEAELLKRGFSFSINAESGRHEVEIGDGRMLVSLENLQRDVASDGDVGRVSRFIDAIVASSRIPNAALSPDNLYWCLEPNDYEEPADFRVGISDRVDRVLIHLSGDGKLITWLTPKMLNSLGFSESDAGAMAFTNLGRALSEAKIESQEIDGVHLGFISTSLPFKAALILAPNLRGVAGAVLGWPLMAVAPDRDFLYLWAAQHKDFVQRVGAVVVREYSKASYPISTEVYEISDESIRAVGEFSRGS